MGRFRGAFGCSSVALGAALVIMPVPAAAAPLPCSSTSAGEDGREFTCRIQAADARRPLRFKAFFSGGHDDTVASLQVTLDGSPLTCGEGSKTRLMGEDGDVSLECRISVPSTGDSNHVLTVLIKWSHAQYTDAGLQVD